MGQINQIYRTYNVTIASGQTTSGAIDLEGYEVHAISLPSAFTGTSITFQGSLDGTTYQAIYNTANTQMSMSVTQNRLYKVEPADLSGLRYLKLVSGSSEGADRAITLLARLTS
jgi:hypothetical protein